MARILRIMEEYDMDKHFVLIIRYECGQCAYLTDTMEIDKALAEFKETQKIKFKDSVMFKDFNLPVITSAEILPLYK